jgi:hypothetical protein
VESRLRHKNRWILTSGGDLVLPLAKERHVDRAAPR